jgi:hypothetical protein
MQCRIWIGDPAVVQGEFNKFAQGKALSKDVIIHTHIHERLYGCDELTPQLTIIVFHAETGPWAEKQGIPELAAKM